MDEYSIKKILLAIAKNNTHKIHVNVLARNELNKHKFTKFPQALIVNSADRYSKSGGVHWLLLLVFSPNECEFFDSYGNPFESYKFYPKLDKHYKIQVNKYQIQSFNSSLCGVYCIYFFQQRLNGKAFE